MAETIFEQFMREVAASLESSAEQRKQAFANVTLAAKKASALLPVSAEMLMDAGVIPDTRPPVHVPWHRRLRYRIWDWRESLGRWLYQVVSGSRFPDSE